MLSSFGVEPGQVAVEAVWSGANLELLFFWRGFDAALVLPPQLESPGRRDDLWRHSCAEMFVALPEGYLEFNFSPSGEWAAYRFDAPRIGMRPHVWADETPPRVSALQADSGSCILGVTLPSAALVSSTSTSCSDFAVGYASVIETKSGVSYWALRHAGSAPDFHDPRGFSARLGNSQ